MHPTPAIPYEDVRALTVTVLRTGIMLSDLLANLLDDLPDDAFPGEQPGEVLVEMLTGTITPVVEAAGAAALRDTIALLDGVADRVLADLRATVELSRRASG
ncbi:MAG: hypothetical protein QOJ35_2358 [Solirubrobacteraceae bacterium]|jgi:hypothetical protein|nr:hypothetical protein [Solirubrobacteraceae bacterium]